MIEEIFDLMNKLVQALPDTIERDGQLYKVQLVPVEKDELIDNTKVIDEFNEEVENIDPDIWEITIDLFGKKYNAKLFDDLMSKKLLTKEETEQLKNAMIAFHACLADAANVRINQLTDKYINGTKLDSAKN